MTYLVDLSSIILICLSKTKKTIISCVFRLNKNTVYFCVDDEKKPHKGVRGKASATIIEETSKILSVAEKIPIKYYGDLENEEEKLFLEYVKNVLSVVLELEPKYLAT